jgi:hypothetical protein
VAELQFDRVGKQIIIVSPDIIITIQELYDKVRDYEDEPANLDLNQIISAGGKEDLGGGVSVGITATLLDGWQLFFQTLSQDTAVRGGNLVALDDMDVSQSPIANSNIVKLELSSGTTAIETSGGLTSGNIDDIAIAVWDETTSTHTSDGTFGNFVQNKLLTVAKWLGLK